ncbi:Hypothetical protein DEACI_4131 [Acididesulfobacillus acetoxydans]|uniref:Uncharacterized protein n=1 Tax=Acididesulfobacillus acetoxydans TaxID=1561005 RepID=A0A8S0W5M6_9FIRM|nr:Hypothetical protein DEACI_4131 [Acididesulfobacillus acetoxydans]
MPQALMRNRLEAHSAPVNFRRKERSGDTAKRGQSQGVRKPKQLSIQTKASTRPSGIASNGGNGLEE